MITTVEISDSEDTDDCVIKSIVYVVDDEPDSELYREVSKENKLLADFMEKCLNIDNTKCMLKVLKGVLLKVYNEADKSARESIKFQKNIRRAIYHLQTDPSHVYTHIQCLCTILKTYRFKKRVPFVTLSTNVTDKSDEQNRSNIMQVNDVVNSAPCNSSGLSYISDSMDTSMHDMCEVLEESMSIETCPQSGFIPKKIGPVLTTSTARIKAIDNKIEQYKKSIALLDELEVDDDSVNSPYIQCERLKIKLVSLYNERCKLVGSQPKKSKGVYLKLRDGHPPGPTKALERFLNKNLNKNGDPPFPDFCDVVACVTEANNKDNLGWTKAQIINEASGLFTQCGEALQKRRQIREYQDLLYKFRLEKDPADDDPALKSKLEENKRIAVKKESDILERYTRMQYLPRKQNPQKSVSNIENSGNENIGLANIKDSTEQRIINNDNNIGTKYPDVSNWIIEESGNKYDNAISTVNVKPIINASISNSIVHSQQHEETLHGNFDKELENCSSTNATMDVEYELTGPDSFNIHTKIDTAEYNVRDCDTKSLHDKTICNDKFIKPNKVKDKDIKSDKNSKESNKTVTSKSNVDQEPEVNTIDILEKLGDNFTLTIEVLDET